MGYISPSPPEFGLNRLRHGLDYFHHLRKGYFGVYRGMPGRRVADGVVEA